ncbi:hypothetical protein [Bordetella ansorpii]|uniref:hypothetical protein n=1 Tax=Bordetella ansorpii TaxID=288768 RepID=UPI000826EBFD|nr:hypothetical protein [Bordetella ansorpii]
MTARDLEQAVLDRCISGALGRVDTAQSQAEASVFRFAAMALDTADKTWSTALWHASDAYFSKYPDNAPTPLADLIRTGHVLSVSRLRDMLLMQLSRQVSH